MISFGKNPIRKPNLYLLFPLKKNELEEDSESGIDLDIRTFSRVFLVVLILRSHRFKTGHPEKGTRGEE